MLEFIAGGVVGVVLTLMFMWSLSRWDDYKFRHTMRRPWGGG